MRYTHVLSCAGLAAALASLAGATPAMAQKEQQFSWHGRIASGQTVEVRGINGSIDASPATGSEVEVVAVKRGRRDDPSQVKIDVVPHAGGVTICAVYPSRSGRPTNDCQPGGGHSDIRDNDVSVEFTVRVPAGVAFLGRNVNGGIGVKGLTGNVDAQTVNGGIEIATRGIARAKTVNGSIDVVMGSTDWTGDLEFESVNGAVQVTLPANASAHVTASTVNGGLNSDFPLMVQGRLNPRHIEGTIGQGGRELRLQTVNGSIELRRS